MTSNKRRGSRYERLAKKDLEAQGFRVVKSSASLGMFDLWALGDISQPLLRLIQVKSVKRKNNFIQLQKELEKVAVPSFCQKELWIWEDRKGWRKILLAHYKPT